MARRMAGQRHVSLIASAALLCPLATLAAPVDLSGEVGYAYRLMKSDTEETVSNQLRGAIRGQTYLSQPWIATVDANLRVTQDKTDYSLTSNANINDSTTTLITGELNLNVIPQSRFPLSISYQVNDSRVDTVNTITSPLTAAGSREFETRRLSIRQSLDLRKAGRYQFNYDNNEWKSTNSEKYSDWLLGGNGDISWDKNRLQLRGSYKVIDRATLSQESTNITLSGDHFYYPTRAVRVDTSADYYNYETESEPSAVVFSNGERETTSEQVSSFIFWRPTDRPVTASAGVRIFNLDSDAGSTNTGPSVINNETELLSMNATAGGMYQYSKNLRFDANVNFSINDNGTNDNNSHLGRVGALLQSDIHEVLGGAGYQWYASAAAQMQGTEDEDRNTLSANLGHDANRAWLNDDKSSTLRLSLSQAASMAFEGGDVDSDTQRLDHSATLGWDSYGGSGSTYAALTISDAHNFGDSDSDQQLVNMQISRTQNLTRRSSLTGNITAQSVRQNFSGQDDSETSTTTTGSLNYQHSRLFGAPRLRFGSDLRLSRASEDRGVDRSEWENRLDYSVGLVDTRASWRLIDAGEQDYSLVYFQVTRRF